jgi:hypothetical protein
MECFSAPAFAGPRSLLTPVLVLTLVACAPAQAQTQAALQAQLDAGGIVTLSATTIALREPLRITRSVTLQGSGSRSQLVAPTDADFPALIVATEERVRLVDFWVTASGPRPLTSIGILVQGSTPQTMSYGLTLENLDIAWQGIGIDIRAASRYRIVGCYIVESQWIGVRLNNAVNPDTGDGMITETTFDTRAPALAAIYQQSGGGLRLLNNKILEHRYGVWLDVAGGVRTSILILVGNSLEHQETSLKISRAASSASFGGVVVTGNQIVASGPGLDIPAWVTDVTVGDNVVLASPALVR